MLNPDHAFLADILIAARKVKRFVSGVGREEFEADDMRESAVIRELTVIGEAAKNVSPEFRAAHPGIPWRKMAGMRDVLVHAYRRVDLGEVWGIATESVPPLIEVLEPLVAAAERQLEDTTQ
jgi:uncharacterized protein with HEPN domain